MFSVRRYDPAEAGQAAEIETVPKRRKVQTGKSKETDDNDDTNDHNETNDTQNSVQRNTTSSKHASVFSRYQSAIAAYVEPSVLILIFAFSFWQRRNSHQKC